MLLARLVFETIFLQFSTNFLAIFLARKLRLHTKFIREMSKKGSKYEQAIRISLLITQVQIRVLIISFAEKMNNCSLNIFHTGKLRQFQNFSRNYAINIEKRSHYYVYYNFQTKSSFSHKKQRSRPFLQPAGISV